MPYVKGCATDTGDLQDSIWKQECKITQAFLMFINCRNNNIWIYCTRKNNRHEFEQTPGDSEGQGSLVCCNPWGCWVRHDLNMKSNKNWFLKFQCSLQKITYVVCICGLNYTVIGQHWSRPGARKIWPVDKIQPSTFFFFFLSERVRHHLYFLISSP